MTRAGAVKNCIYILGLNHPIAGVPDKTKSIFEVYGNDKKYVIKEYLPSDTHLRKDANFFIFSSLEQIKEQFPEVYEAIKQTKED